MRHQRPGDRVVVMVTKNNAAMLEIPGDGLLRSAPAATILDEEVAQPTTLSDEKVKNHPHQSRESEVQKTNGNIYATDDYPRKGCQVVIEFLDGKYMWRVYAPAAAQITPGGLLESYASRPMASIGIALAAFAAGRTVRSVMPEMVQAERKAAADQVPSSQSNVTL